MLPAYIDLKSLNRWWYGLTPLILLAVILKHKVILFLRFPSWSVRVGIICIYLSPTSVLSTQGSRPALPRNLRKHAPGWTSLLSETLSAPLEGQGANAEHRLRLCPQTKILLEALVSTYSQEPSSLCVQRESSPNNYFSFFVVVFSPEFLNCRTHSPLFTTKSR